MTDQDVKIAQLEWALAVLALQYINNESEATVILPSRALGIYAGFIVTLTQGDDYATIVHVKVLRGAKE